MMHSNECDVSKKTVVIIGAGAGGTTIAARLSRKGFNVQVFEKNNSNGGRCSLIYKNGFRFDQGPSIYLMPKIFEKAFIDLDESIDDHYQLLRCPTNYRIYFSDGRTFVLSTDICSMYEQLKQFEEEDGTLLSRFFDFIKESKVHYDGSLSLSLKKNYSSFVEASQLQFFFKLFNMHIFQTVYSRVCNFFKSKHIRRALSFQPMSIGMSPYNAPGFYTFLQYTEMVEGMWYPKGGFQKVLSSIENIAIKHGAKFEYNAPVEKIIIENKKAIGIKLSDGRFIPADFVVCNADLVYAYNKLLPTTSYGNYLGNKGILTSSSISFYWGLKERCPGLTIHNVFLSEECKKSFDEVLLDNEPEEISFYLHVPSRIDPDAAPEDKDSIVVILPIGHIKGKNQDFDKLIEIARNKVIKRLESHLKIDFKSLIEIELVNDPRTWAEKFNLWKGSIIGLTHSMSQILWFRPNTKSHIFDKLYFVGASTHPNAGVPIILNGAKLVENQILDDLIQKKSQGKSLIFKLMVSTILVGFCFLTKPLMEYISVTFEESFLHLNT